MVRVFEISMVSVDTTPPMAKVTMNEGKRSRVCNTPDKVPAAMPVARPMGNAQ
ncbi:hypothetical protein D9M71_588120 [compost metagenome]